MLWDYHRSWKYTIPEVVGVPVPVACVQCSRVVPVYRRTPGFIGGTLVLPELATITEAEMIGRATIS